MGGGCRGRHASIMDAIVKVGSENQPKSENHENNSESLAKLARFGATVGLEATDDIDALKVVFCFRRILLDVAEQRSFFRMSCAALG